jgi:hypothetical protein
MVENGNVMNDKFSVRKNENVLKMFAAVPSQLCEHNIC